MAITQRDDPVIASRHRFRLQAEGERHIRLNAGASDLPSLNTRKKPRWRPPLFPTRPKPWLLQWS